MFKFIQNKQTGFQTLYKKFGWKVDVIPTNDDDADFPRQYTKNNLTFIVKTLHQST
jgi:hypothetical protein